jgi:hypothetical protein
MTTTLWGQVEDKPKASPKKLQSKKQVIHKVTQVYDFDLPTDYDNPRTEQEDNTYILSLPIPLSGEELADLRREIGKMVRAEEAQWEHSNELDPAWPPSANVYKRLYRKGGLTVMCEHCQQEQAKRDGLCEACLEIEPCMQPVAPTEEQIEAMANELIRAESEQRA